jgi:hypothetical protein
MPLWNPLKSLAKKLGLRKTEKSEEIVEHEGPFSQLGACASARASFCSSYPPTMGTF